MIALKQMRHATRSLFLQCKALSSAILPCLHPIKNSLIDSVSVYIELSAIDDPGYSRYKVERFGNDRRFFAAKRPEDEPSQLTVGASDDDEWTVAQEPQHDDVEGPPTFEEIRSAKNEARESWSDLQPSFTQEVADKYRKALQFSVVYFQVHHQDLTTIQLSEMIQQFSELVPDNKHRVWMMDLCADTVFHLVQIYLEKIESAEEIDVAEFSRTIKAMGNFGVPLQRYCIETEANDTLWRFGDIAVNLVPYFSAEALIDVLSGFANMNVFVQKFLEETLLFVDMQLTAFSAELMVELLRCMAHFKYEQSVRVLHKMIHVISSATAKLPSHLLTSCLWYLVCFKWKNANDLHKALLEEIQKRFGELEAPELLNLAAYLTATRYYPGDQFLRDFCQDFVHRTQYLSNKRIFVRNALALAYLGCQDTEALDVIKQNVTRWTTAPIKVVIQIGWTLSILNAWDIESVQWWMRFVDQADESSLELIQQRQLYQTLMHIYVLQPDLGQHIDVDPELERACRDVWKKEINRAVYTSPAKLKVLKNLRDMGFICRRYERIFGGRFEISICLHRYYPQRLAIFCENGFWNIRSRLRGPQLWKENMINGIGWLVISIRIDDWERLDTGVERFKFLRQNIADALEQRINQEKGVTI